MVPVFTANRSISLAPSFAPAASPWLRRRPSPWPPHRHAKPASESAIHTGRPCTASRPISTRFEPVPRLRSFMPLVPLVCRLISLAGPSPSGSPEPSRLCQRCFPPSPTSPGSGCAQLLPSSCDHPARRTSTSFGQRRLTAHQRLAAHLVRSTCQRCPGLDGRLVALMGDLAGHSPRGKLIAGGLGVIPGVEVDPDVIGPGASGNSCPATGCRPMPP
jgi:hypothetical protein